MSQDYISFEEALKELNLRSTELKKLMSEGQIRGIREGDSIKFRKDEVERLARTKGEELAEELLFVDEDGLEEGMATAEISEEDTLLEAEPEVLEEDIQLPAEEEKKETRPARRAQSSSARRSSRPRREEKEETQQEKTWERILLVATTAVMLYGIFAVLAAISGRVDGMTEFLANLFKP